MNKRSKTKEKITVKEYLSKGTNPEKAFREMVESGDKCSGLVYQAPLWSFWRKTRKRKAGFIIYGKAFL